MRPAGPGVEQTRRILRRTLPEAQVIDYRETHPTITRGLDRATTFLNQVMTVDPLSPEAELARSALGSLNK